MSKFLKLLAGISSDVQYEYLGETNMGGGTTSTATGANLGTPHPKRLIVVAAFDVMSGGIAAQPTSCTIAGVAATAIAAGSSGNWAGATTGVGMYYALVPTGATGNIVVTYSQNVPQSRIHVWALYDYQSSTPYHTSAAIFTTPPTDTTISGTINEARGGITLAAVGVPLAPKTITPSGVTDRDSGSGFNVIEKKATVTATAVSYSYQTGRTLILAHWR